MKTRHATLLSGILLSACTMDARIPRPTDPPDAEAGRKTFLRACASCHGEDARGTERVPRDLTLLAHGNGGVYAPELVTEVVTGERVIAAHQSGEMSAWETTFRPRGSGAAAAGSLRQQIRIAEIAAFVGTLQREP